MITIEQYNNARNVILSYRKQLLSEINNIDKLVIEYQTPINELNISVRMYNMIKHYGCKTMENVLCTPISEFRKLRNWGKKSDAELIVLKKEFSNE